MNTNISKNLGGNTSLLEGSSNVKDNEIQMPSLENLSNAIDRDMNTTNGGFPVDVFPLQIQNLIDNANKTVNFDKDYLSAGILSICATAIGNSVSLFNGSYMAKPILWLSIIGSRGTGKTHPLSFAKKPIEYNDNESYKEYQVLKEEFEQRDQNSQGNKPKYTKLILKDFTPEKLADSLQFSDKGILIFQDELMRWINSFDKYNKGGDQQMYLDLFNGTEFSVDRVSKDAIRVEETNVNILGGMQPEIVRQLAKNNRSEDGFLDRFLFVYPKNLKPKLFTGLDIAKIHSDGYSKLINNLLNVPHQTIVANASNINIFRDWQHENVKKYYHDTVERSIQAKMETYVWRLALIIEMMEQGIHAEFSPRLKDKNLNKSISLIEYFRSNALTVHDKMLNMNPLEDLTVSQLGIYNNLPLQFKRADVLNFFKKEGFSIRSADRFLQKKEIFFTYQNSKDLKAGNYKKKFHQ